MDGKKKKVNICRFCLNTDIENSKSLFDPFKDRFIFDHINLITNIGIKPDDGLPDQMCPHCFLEFKTAINFKEKCEQSNLVLRSSVSSKTNLEVEIKIKKEEPEESIEYLEDDAIYFNQEEGLKNVKHEDLLVEHVAKKSTTIHLQCNECGINFKSKCKLRVHWKKVHLVEALFCNLCKRTFKSYATFNRHKVNQSKSCTTLQNVNIQGIGKSRLFCCKDCDYKTHRIKDIKMHLLKHNGEKPHQCNLCPSRYTQLGSLDAHKETKHKIYKKEMTCHICGKYVKGRNKIYTHMKIHTEPKYQCDVCKKMLKGKTGLINHLARHSGVKSYTCEKCAQSFYTNVELCNHRRNVHQKGMYWYYCNMCSFKSIRSERMNKHKKQHSTNDLPCTVCGMFLENEQKLNLHQRRHFEEKKYKCPQCDMKFFRKDSIGKHVRVKHRSMMLFAEKNSLNVKKESAILGGEYEDNMIEVEISDIPK